MSEEEYSPVDSKASWGYPGAVKPRKDRFQNALRFLLLVTAVFLLYLARYDYHVKGSHSSLGNLLADHNDDDFYKSNGA